MGKFFALLQNCEDEGLKLAATGINLREGSVHARGETTIRLAAGGEVVLAAGALASPQLLQGRNSIGI